jgi:hypothetical protein
MIICESGDFLKLEGCPFCGEPPSVYIETVDDISSFLIIQCFECDIDMISDDHEYVLNRWSNRALTGLLHSVEVQ